MINIADLELEYTESFPCDKSHIKFYQVICKGVNISYMGL